MHAIFYMYRIFSIDVIFDILLILTYDIVSQVSWKQEETGTRLCASLMAKLVIENYISYSWIFLLLLGFVAHLRYVS